MLNHQKFQRQARLLREAGARFLSFAASETGTGEFELDYYFEHLGQVEQLRTRTEELAAPSLIALFSYCDFPEREAFRQYRIKFLGNPNLVTLAQSS